MKIIDNHFGEHLTIGGYGAVYDYEGTRVGKVAGGHIKLGGAALLLLAR